MGWPARIQVPRPIAGKFNLYYDWDEITAGSGIISFSRILLYKTAEMLVPYCIYYGHRESDRIEIVFPKVESMANIKSLKGKKYAAAELVALASNYPDASDKDFQTPRPVGVPTNLLKVVNLKDPNELDLRNRLFNAHCAAPIQVPAGNPKTSSKAGWAFIIQLYPGADAPTKAKRAQADAPMRSLRNTTFPAAVLKTLHDRWEEYYTVTRPEAQRKWNEAKAQSLKTADISAIARMRNPGERAKALRALADQEEQGFEQYLAREFGSEMVMLLGVPDVPPDKQDGKQTVTLSEHKFASQN